MLQDRVVDRVLQITLPENPNDAPLYYRDATQETLAFVSAAPAPWNPAPVLRSSKLFDKAQQKGPGVFDEAAVQLGALLFDEAAATYLRAQIEAGPTPLRIELVVPDRLADYPWEAAHLNGPEQIGVHPDLTVVRRHLPRVPRATRPPVGGCRTIAAGASPPGHAKLAISAEVDEIRRVSGDHLRFRPPAEEIPAVWDATLEALRDDPPPHVLHFMGHGTDQGALLFVDHAGAKQEIRGDAIAQGLGRLPELRLVTLHACFAAHTDLVRTPFGSLATQLVRHGVPAVVAASTPLFDGVGPRLAHHLYAALAAGEPVDVAVQRARRELFEPSGGHWSWRFLTLHVDREPGPIVLPSGAAGDRPARGRAIHELDYEEQTQAIDACPAPAIIVVKGPDGAGHDHMQQRVLERRRDELGITHLEPLMLRLPHVRKLASAQLLGQLATALALPSDGPAKAVEDRIRTKLRGEAALFAFERRLEAKDLDCARAFAEVLRRIAYGDGSASAATLLAVIQVGWRPRWRFLRWLEEGWTARRLVAALRDGSEDDRGHAVTLELRPLPALPSRIPPDLLVQFGATHLRLTRDEATELAHGLGRGGLTNEAIIDELERLLEVQGVDRA